MLGFLTTAGAANYIAYEQKKKDDEKRSGAVGGIIAMIISIIFTIIFFGIAIYILYYNYIFAKRCHNGDILHYLLGFFMSGWYFLYRLFVVYGNKTKATCFNKM